MRQFVTLPAPSPEATPDEVVRYIADSFKALIGMKVTDKVGFAQCLTNAIEAKVAAECPGAQAGKHFTVNVHSPKSRRKKRLGFVKIVIRPLPRSRSGIAYQPKVPAEFIEVTCTLLPREASVAD